MKKQNEAMEFLMTYGWVILISLSVIGLLAYSGVLSPDKFLPEKCVLPSGLACLDFNSNDLGFQLIIQNYVNQDLRNVTITLQEDNIKCSPSQTTKLMKDGQTHKFIIDCNMNNTDDYKFNGDIIVSYVSYHNSLKTKTGQLIAKI